MANFYLYSIDYVLTFSDITDIKDLQFSVQIIIMDDFANNIITVPHDLQDLLQILGGETGRKHVAMKVPAKGNCVFKSIEYLYGGEYSGHASEFNIINFTS